MSDDRDTEVAHQAFHRFLAIHRHIRCHERQMSEHGLRPRQYSFLRSLYETGPCTVGQLQHHHHTSASTASTLIGQLEELGLATRTRSSEDNRVVIVELTESGREVAIQAPFGGIPLFKRRLQSAPPDRVSAINAALGDIMELMEVGEDE